MRNVYLAGSWELKNTVASQKRLFQSYGFNVTSTWTEEPSSPRAEEGTVYTNAYRAGIAHRDVSEIYTSDGFVLFTAPGIAGGGRHFEMGTARERGCEIVIVGEPENVFYYLDGITYYANLAALQQALHVGAFVPS